MLISPTEPEALKMIGKVSSMPEDFGADVLIFPHESWGGPIGVQRKEVKDLVASMHDGRLSEQVLKMSRCTHSYLVVEGKLVWSTDGTLMGKQYGTPFQKEHFYGLKWTARTHGVEFDFTDNLDDTCRYLLHLEKWSQKERHDSMFRRPGPAGSWGVAGARDWEKHFLCAIPAIGPVLAERILDTVGMPLRWGVTAEQLAKVEGLGARKIERIMKAFPM